MSIISIQSILQQRLPVMTVIAHKRITVVGLVVIILKRNWLKSIFVF